MYLAGGILFTAPKGPGMGVQSSQNEGITYPRRGLANLMETKNYKFQWVG